MAVIYAKLGPDWKQHIHEVPEGVTPDEVAEAHGLPIFDYCETVEEALRRMAKDPNGKLESL